MMIRGLPLVLAAPSGAGKSTLTKKLLSEFPNFNFSVSYTTRPPRQGEEHGKDYYFINEEEFKSKIDENFFAEWAKVHDCYYGTPLSEIEENLSNGKDMLFDIDIQGASQLKLTLPETYFVFIFPPDMKELERRLYQRNTDSEEAIRTRLGNATSEIRQAFWFDAWIVNDNLIDAYDKLRACVLSAKLSPQRHTSLLNTFMQDEIKGKQNG